jgi:N-acetylglucosamine-6-phosphate deacetylase
MIALTAATLFTPLERIERPLLLLDDGVIAEATSQASREVARGCRVVNFADCVLAPGFIDIHNHGGGGHDVMESDPAALPIGERLLATHGVTAYLPTTVTAPVDSTLAALQRLADAIEAGPSPSTNGLRARPLGIHIEGPFLSHARRGVHPPSNLLRPTVEMFERFWQASRGHIKMMTIAPELDGALEVISAAASRGVTVSMGHSDADFGSAQAAVIAGARHATHTFNAMRPFTHRDPGIVGEVLTDSRLTADIIVDGVHLDPAVVQLFLHTKGSERAVLISDATAATGMPDGRYVLGDFEIEVKDGKCLVDGTLAGSVLTLDQAVRNVMKMAKWNLQQSLRPATLNPARIVDLAGRGEVKTGAVADLVVLGPAGDVRATVVGGQGL